MKRVDQLALELEQKLAPDILAVAKPDLPHLLKGPDLLLADPGSLVAAFLTKTAERRDPSKLTARLIASRLTLPPNTRCVLLLRDNESESPIGNENFHELFNIDDVHSLRRFVQDKNLPIKVNEVPHKIRTLARKRYAIIYEIATEVSGRQVTEILENRASLKRGMQTHVKSPESLGPPPVVSTITAYPSRMTAGSESPQRVMWMHGKHRREQLWSDVSTTLSKSFQLDNGIPYPVDILPDVLVASEVPVGQADPLKPLRGAAFGGCLIAPEEAASDVDNLLDRLDRRIRAIRS